MIYMFLADGFEESEALVPLDLIRRAGIDIKTVSLTGAAVCGSHSIRVIADISADEVNLSDLNGIILPGGMPGTENLYADASVCKAVDYCIGNDKMIAAICAAPIILGRKGLLHNKKAVCYPGFEAQLENAVVSSVPCVKDGNIITAKGAGCVFEFAHEIISYLRNTDAADKVIKEIQHKGL